MITLSIIVGIVMVAGGACIFSDAKHEYQFKNK
jgi:hypothetical protein